MDSLVLAIETATDICDVALGNAEGVRARRTLDEPRSHARHLVVMIQELVEESGMKKKELAAIAVSAGPGSYTGLRIGVSAAKGLAFAIGCPLLGVATLEALVEEARIDCQPGDLLLPVLPSRKGEAYLALFERNEAGMLATKLPASALELGEAVSRLTDLGNASLYIGGSTRARDIMEMLPGEVNWLPSIAPSAASVLALACRRLQEDPGVDDGVADFEPAYLKEFIAKKPKGSIFDRLPF